MPVTHQMQGLAELNRRLKQLPEQLRDRPVKAGLRNAGKVLKKALEQAAPFDGLDNDGVHIRENIVVGRSRSRSNQTQEVFTVGVKLGTRTLSSGRKVKSEGDAFYWKFIEFGSSHQAPQPFFRPTSEAQVTAMSAAFEKAMEKAVKRLERQNGITP